MDTYIPAGSRLERQVEAQRLRDSLVTEVMVLLACKKSPTFIRDRLNAFLPPSTRNYFNTFDGVTDSGTGARALLSGGGQVLPLRLLRSVKR